MKKYRPIKLWIILLVLIIFGIVLGVFYMDGWKQVLILVCASIIFVGFILCTTYYVQFEKDRIIIRHGLSSFNKLYKSNLKTRCVLFSDINYLSINHSSKYVVFSLKNGNNFTFSFGGYINIDQIIREFKIVSDEINKNNTMQ